MKSKSPSAPKFTDRIRISTFDFTTALSIDECIQRLVASNHTRPFDGEGNIEVVTVDQHFTISLFDTIEEPDDRLDRKALCTGDLKVVPSGTRVTAKARVASPERKFRSLVSWAWVAWFAGVLMVFSIRLKTDQTLYIPVLLCAVFMFCLPLLTYIGIKLDMNQSRRKLPIFANWLYWLLFEIEDDRV